LPRKTPNFSPENILEYLKLRNFYSLHTTSPSFH